ncbi:PREDICTED: zinc finger protein 85-like [Branchiostoma belcheri]|uniref:Zinc finger protein 85-like n=1 Tax=Branchiostoma belcheri TaxID=7741 RepID=A0A6P4Y986_BRABE|nr:PREDICTED: zinc finger protein 85-like [Branchiostoma belcheri]
MATTGGAKICGLCKEVTLAVLPRLHQEELLLELDRRNILVGETYKKESLVSKLWGLMVKEFQGTDHSVIPEAPTAATGTPHSSAAEQRTMWATLSNDLQELMETVTSTNSATATVPVTPTTNNADSHVSLTNGVGTTSTIVTTPTKSTKPTPTQPVTVSSPLRVPVLAQEVVVETTTVTSPRRSARLHNLETQVEASSSTVRNLMNIGDTVETLEESTVTKEGLGKGYLKRELRAITVTRQSCSVGSNTVVTDLGAIRELADEDQDDPDVTLSEDEEEDEVSSDEDDDGPLDDDDSDWQPESPMEDSNSDKEASGKDSNSSPIQPSEEAAPGANSQGEVSTSRHDDTANVNRDEQQGLTTSKTVKCPECEFTTTSKQRLYCHKTSHDKTRPFACDKCDYRARLKQGVKVHLKLIHGQGQVYKCKECEFSTEGRRQFFLHMSQEHGARGALCELCGHRASTPSLLKKHMYKHTGEKPYKCSQCAYAATSLSTFMRHTKTSHPGQKCFKCNFCSHLAENRNLLRKHVKTHKAEHVHKCPVRSCEFTSNESAELVLHLATKHKKHQQCSCAVCNHKTFLLRELKEHMKTTGHGKLYLCDKCGFAAKTYSSLTSHRKGHNRTSKYKCDQCSFSSCFKSIITNHSKIHGPDPFQCRHCDFKADNQTDFSIHLGKHVNSANTMTCDMCGYIAKTEEALEQHIKEHSTAEHIYRCSTRGCDFSTPDRLCFVRHETSHKPDRRFTCDHCDYRAKKKSSLATHMRIHTGEKPLKCSKCSYATSLDHLLRSHEARHKAELKAASDS